MKKFLLGFAFIATLALMFTSCPGPKPKDSVSGKFDDLACGKTYNKNSGKELTINLETDQFKNAMTVDSKATGINIKFKSSAAAADAEPENYSDKFLVKTGTSANDKSVILYFVGGPYAEETSGELSIEIAADALVERSKVTDAEALSLGSIAFKVSPDIEFSNYQLVYSYVEGKKAAGAEGDATVLSVVPMAISGALFKVDAGDTETKALTLDGSSKDYVDISNWFEGLPNGVSAVRRKIEAPEGESETYKGADSINVRFVVLEANKTVASTSAAKVFANVPAAALTITSPVKSSNNLTFFITKDPNAEEASKKPKLTISNGSITGKVGEAITEAEFTLTIDGDCVANALDTASRTEINNSNMLRSFIYCAVVNGSSTDYSGFDMYDFIKAEIPEDIELGATSFKVKLSAATDKIVNIPAIDGKLVARLPGSSSSMPLLLNKYDNNGDDNLQSEINNDAKFVITDDRSVALSDVSFTFATPATKVEMTVTLTNETVKDGLASIAVRGWFDSESRRCITDANVKSVADDKKSFVVEINLETSKPTEFAEANKVTATFTIPGDKLEKGADLSTTKEINFAATT